MAYHFDNRRLVFLKTPDLVELVHALETHSSLQAAVEAAAPNSEKKQQSYLKALASLSEAEVICERTPTPDSKS